MYARLKLMPELLILLLTCIAVLLASGFVMVTVQRNLIARATMYAVLASGNDARQQTQDIFQWVTGVPESSRADASLLYLLTIQAAQQDHLDQIDWTGFNYQELFATPRGRVLLQAVDRWLDTTKHIHAIARGMSETLRWEWALRAADARIDLIYLRGSRVDEARLFAQFLWEIWVDRPTDERRSQLAGLYGRFGRYYLSLKQPDVAVEWLDRALALEPLYCDAILDKGLSVMRLGQRESGLAMMQHSVNMCPDYAHGWASLGAEYLANDLTTAESAIRRSVEISPTYGYAQLLLAQVLVRQGRCSEALSPAQMAVKVYPMSDYLEQLGDVYWCLGDFSQAVGVYGQVVKMDPSKSDRLRDRLQRSTR
jgi:tetratricopeptide (TPR) repeat protein